MYIHKDVGNKTSLWSAKTGIEKEKFKLKWTHSHDVQYFVIGQKYGYLLEDRKQKKKEEGKTT